MPPPETPKHSQASLAQSLVGVTAPFSWALMCTRFCCAPEESLSPQSCGSSVMKSCQLSNSDSLGIPSPFTRSPGQTGSLLWGLEVLLQCENFFGMIVLQFVGRPPGSSRVGLMQSPLRGLTPRAMPPRLLLPLPIAGHCWCSLHRASSSSQRQAWLSLLWGHCSFRWVLVPTRFGWCPPKISGRYEV